jgi:hypothetical protein
MLRGERCQSNGGSGNLGRAVPDANIVSPLGCEFSSCGIRVYAISDEQGARKNTLDNWQ